jgi:hypothetical protein
MSYYKLNNTYKVNHPYNDQMYGVDVGNAGCSTIHNTGCPGSSPPPDAVYYQTDKYCELVDNKFQCKDEYKDDSNCVTWCSNLSRCICNGQGVCSSDDNVACVCSNEGQDPKSNCDKCLTNRDASTYPECKKQSRYYCKASSDGGNPTCVLSETPIINSGTCGKAGGYHADNEEGCKKECLLPPTKGGCSGTGDIGYCTHELEKKKQGTNYIYLKTGQDCYCEEMAESVGSHSCDVFAGSFPYTTKVVCTDGKVPSKRAKGFLGITQGWGCT